MTALKVASIDIDIEDSWFVTNGVVSIGPISYALLQRGIAHARIPAGSQVRHTSWRVWRPLREIQELTEDARSAAVRELARVTEQAEERASQPFNEPVTAAPCITIGPDDTTAPSSTVRTSRVDPVGVLACARDLDDAMLLALSTAVTAAHADVGLLHRRRPEHGQFATSCAQGPSVELLLGERLDNADPMLKAAMAGRSVLSEPEPGPASAATLARVSQCTGNAKSAAMVPVFVHDKLVAIIEVASVFSELQIAHIARVEEVVEALVARIFVAGWEA